jgi:hypothetical protein
VTAGQQLLKAAKKLLKAYDDFRCDTTAAQLATRRRCGKAREELRAAVRQFETS